MAHMALLFPEGEEVQPKLGTLSSLLRERLERGVGKHGRQDDGSTVRQGRGEVLPGNRAERPPSAAACGS
ncbi:hypothetical protein AOLI_G00143050 [Acnodon oligacanthus]